MADKVEYIKDGEKLKVAKTFTVIEEETFSLKDLMTRKKQLESDLAAYQEKTAIEINSWNEAIALIDEQIAQAKSLGVSN